MAGSTLPPESFGSAIAVGSGTRRRPIGAGPIADLARAVARRGRRSRPRRLVDMRGVTDDPFEALRQSGRSMPLIEVPLTRLRQYSVTIPLVRVDANPFSRVVAEILRDPTLDYESSSLYRFYDAWRPRSAAEVYGVPEGGPLGLAPPTPDCLPWRIPGAIDALVASCQAHEQRCAERWGPAPGSGHGFRSFGPVSAVAGRHYFDDYSTLTASIVKRGYIVGETDHPRIEVLSNGSKWVGRLTAGNHRIAVLAALGHETTTVAVDPRVISIDAAGSWSSVRSGTYLAADAAAVLDRFVEGVSVPGFPQFGPSVSTPAAEPLAPRPER